MHKVEKKTTQLDIFIGFGGVGKTTLSTAYALVRASQGEKTLVLTVDPSQRLAQMLQVDLKAELQEVRHEKAQGQLHYLTLDSASILNQLIEKHLPEKEHLKKLKEHPFFQILSNSLSEMTDYMAFYKLNEFIEQGEYDRIVLDTPPSIHALNFLEAPKKLQNFIESRMIQLLIEIFQESETSQKKGFLNKVKKVIEFSTQKVLSLLGQLLGDQFLKEMVQFFIPLKMVMTDLEEKMNRLNRLMVSSHVQFNMVVTPKSQAIKEIEFFQLGLKRHQKKIQKVWMNQSHQHFELQEPDKKWTYIHAYYFYLKKEQLHQAQIADYLKKSNIPFVTLPAYDNLKEADQFDFLLNEVRNHV